MKLFNKIVNDENKAIAFDVIVAAIALVPVYGEYAESGMIILNSLKKLVLNIGKDLTVYHKIKEKIGEIKIPDDLETSDIVSITETIHAILQKDDFDLNIALCTSEMCEKLKDEVFRASNHRRDVALSYKSYISQIIDTLSSRLIRSLLPQAGQIPIKIIEEIKDTLVRIDVAEGKIEDIQEQMSELQIQVAGIQEQLQKGNALAGNPEEHNKIYREIFQQPLFLENRTDITLEKVYITPMIKDRGCSVTQLIMDWYHSPNAKRCLLLYGDAGVGKTSLIAKIVSDAYRDTDEIEYNFVANEVQTVMLRKKTELFREWYLHSKERNFTDFICALFSVNDIKELQGKLLILDGLDELTVLIPGFKEKARGFIEKLCNISVFKRIKILMTSRSNYFDLHLTSMLNLDVQHLSWEQAQTMEWCDKYSKCFEHEEGLVKKTWCDHFKEYYEQLPKDKDDDKRYEIFCIPIILYLACNSGVELDLEQEQTIGKIYDFAFREVALREHIRYHEDNEQLKDSEADQILRLDHWQYTKELAYQMFLQDTLDLVDSDDPNDSRPEAVGFRNAQNMTRKLRGDENLDLSPSKYQAVFPFSKDNGKGGIAFVHKTVYEYFTAVKLYEDYFAKFNSAFFRQYSPESKEATKAVRDSFIEAFRYKPVTSEIFAYLNDMSKPAFTGTGEDGADTFRFNLFANSFSAGMQQYFLCDFSVFERETAYTASCGWAEMPLSEQIKIAFCNLTWFLTKRENGFGNIDNIDACKEIAELISCRNKRAYLVGWNLSSIDLISTYLRNMYLNHANLANACLESSDLSGADLIGADLTSAELRDANMVGTDLTGACITGADLRNVNLSHADLAGADLTKADLSEANMTKADLSNAIFTDAHLNSAYLVSPH